ncbi:uncharacterized protein LOC115826094 [Chanos chanos]|uniref:THAP domain-containing protein 1 n=1 Tax=Chanos chanos TaxID=29144 RepID=A0A6J2WQ87_CHACN|nr:uncharacterized protein LOC115826094 [Chanos chanos]
MPSCCAYNCKNRSDSAKPGLSFHRFPFKDPKRLKEWVRQTKWKNWSPTLASALCSEHFEEKYLERGGNVTRLKHTAVPTIFNFPKHLQKFPEEILPSPESSVLYEESEEERPPMKPAEEIDWGRISFHPSLFHDDYCLPKSIQWVKEDEQNGGVGKIENLRTQGLLFIPKRSIKVKGRWQWLGVEVKGPLSLTHSGNKFVLSVLDYYSRWVETYPMKTCNSEEIAQNIHDLVTRCGYPYGFLSRVSPRFLREINSSLSKLVQLENTSFVNFHPQAISLDQVTSSLIDRMVFNLAKEHPDSWDLCLPASSGLSP